MNWIDNLKSISKYGEPGRCPKCGSDNTEYACGIVDREQKSGYLDVWCNDCKNAYHISKMEVTNNLKIGPHPKDLIY